MFEQIVSFLFVSSWLVVFKTKGCHQNHDKDDDSLHDEPLKWMIPNERPAIKNFVSSCSPSLPDCLSIDLLACLVD